MLQWKKPTVPPVVIDVPAAALSFDPADPTSFVVGGEDGCVYACQHTGIAAGVQAQLPGHQAFVSSVQHHPTSGKLVLSASFDWSVKLWSLKVRMPPGVSPHDACLRHGC